MKDLYSVDTTFDAKLQRYQLKCPECPAIIRALTHNGVADALCVHLNTAHNGRRDC